MAAMTSPFLDLFAELSPRREGRAYKMRCPFHDDGTPSLSADPEKGLWQCFGCGEGGDAITFLQRNNAANVTVTFPATTAQGGTVTLGANTGAFP